jgi:hypothetical protein
MKYRKKPVVVEAVRFDGKNHRECIKFLEAQGCFTKQTIFIPTLEGTMKASVGDYIIRGVNGECYPCKPDIFEKTYEPVMDESG